MELQPDPRAAGTGATAEVPRHRLRDSSGWFVLAPSLLLLIAGTVGALTDNAQLKDGCWLAAGLIGLAASAVAVGTALVRRSAGVDVLALLAIGGAILTQEYLAAALVAVMVGTGTVLDQWAEATARRELSLLAARSPRVAHRIAGDGDPGHRSRRGRSRRGAACRLRGDRPGGRSPARGRDVR